MSVPQETRRVPVGAQGLLFDDDLPALSEDVGYRGPTACGAAGITYRQLDYWARTGLVEPSVRSATGSGTQRLYSFRDILVLKVVKRLLDTGVSLQQIRVAIDHLRSRGVDDLAQITLMSDGATIFECVTEDEVIGRIERIIAAGEILDRVLGVLERALNHRGEHAEHDGVPRIAELARPDRGREPPPNRRRLDHRGEDDSLVREIDLDLGAHW